MAQQQVTDPYADIATPVTAPATANTSDPYAAIATPLPTTQDPAPAAKKSVLQTAEDVASGFNKDLGRMSLPISRALNAIPVVGETLAPSAGIKAEEQWVHPTNTAEAVGAAIPTAAVSVLAPEAAAASPWIEELAAAEKLTGAARAAKYVDLARKYPLLADTFNLATNHPWLSKMILETGRGAVAGGTAGAVQTGTAKGAAKGAALGGATGAAVAAAPALLNPFRGAKNAVQDYFSDIWQGAEKAQAPAESALREGAQTGAGVPVTQPKALNEVLDQPIAALDKAASQNYKLMDAATENKWQPNVDALKNNAQELRDVAGTDSAREANLLAERTRLEWQQEALLNQASKKGVDKSVVDLARAQTRQMNALTDLDNKVFKNFSVIDLDGNIKVDKALQNLMKLKNNTRWGGTPRLDHALGKDTADALLKSLDEARQQGLKALPRQQLAKKIAKYIGYPTAATATVAAGTYLYHVLTGND